jgi:UDP-N-acetylmuramoyl-tripeptide--D-alanyl-D-alanine ligase
MRFTLLEILGATHGGQIGGTFVGNAFSSFHTDSREVVEGGVFFALKGAEMDGHEFVPDAINRGAGLLIVERRMETLPGVGQVLVTNSWDELYALARYAADRVQPLVVAITGSNGKTSTKELVSAALGRRYNVLHTSGNLNTETGVPLTMLRIEPEHTALVLEMGLQRPGDIGRLVELAQPSIGIITNIGTVHIEFFASQDELAASKGELVKGLPESGLAVLNADDKYFDDLSGMTPAGIRSFGLAKVDYRAESYRAVPEGGSTFKVRGIEVRLGLEGRHQALNAVAALAAADFAGVPLEVGAEALSEVSVEHRLQEIKAPAGFIVVDDAYNASPESMLAAFAAVNDRPRTGRLLAVLGEMRELGGLAEESHRVVGLHAAKVFDAVCVIDGDRARILAEAAGGEVVANRAEAVLWVRRNAQAGDRVLVKGSHGVRLEEVVKELTR